MKFPTFKKEIQCIANGYNFVIGCDEVGVAPLAGPVVAAACVIDPASIYGYRSKSKWYYRVRDSKTTYEDERPDLAEEIKKHCVAHGTGEVSVDLIDKLNIHHASLLAMKIAVEKVLEQLQKISIPSQKNYLFLDGRFIIKDLLAENLVQESVIDGDCSILSISAASIIAKVHRDNILKELDSRFPKYGFAKHKGYNTKQHRQAIFENGITEHHRKSFLGNLIPEFKV